MRRAVFLDRDGTVIANDGDLGDPAALELLPGVAEACATLKALGFSLVVVTNQGGVARGAYDEDAVERTHRALEEMLRRACALPRVIDGFYHCPFHPEGTVVRYTREHPWRKPAPGMLLAAARDLDLDLASSWLVGDAERDVVAGSAAGCRTILLAPEPRALRAESSADFVDRTLLDAAKRIEAAQRADLRPHSAVRLRAKAGQMLADPSLRERILAAARALAERTGVEIVHIGADHSSVEATVVGDEMVAIGFAAELRRSTEQWYRGHTGASLWGES